jgi:class 3 adenylate cyclase
VRIAKRLGDGVMLVGVEVGPTVASAAELMARWTDDTLALRGGIAHGQVLLYDGDDYIGRPANLAARLCDAASPGELLAYGYTDPMLPAWMHVLGRRSVTLRGFGTLADAQSLAMRPDVDLP